jgi:hypothetical protein
MMDIREGISAMMEKMKPKQKIKKEVLPVESPKEEKPVESFESEMTKGKYLQILESYGVSWSPEKVSRDVLQNFFDGNGGTLDGIEININEQENTDKVVKIEGNKEYDYRKLIHLGGTSKTGDVASVGGFGEGTKVMSLVMLRDMGLTDIKFGSGDWQLEFYLDKVDEQSYDKPINGLYTKLTKINPPIEGNFVEFKIPGNNPKLKEYLEVFGRSTDLFKNSDNSDFQNPIYENDSFGMVFLGKDKKGNFYDGGQRRHFDKDEWQTVEGFNIWTKAAAFKADRDRGIVSRSDFLNKVISPAIKSMSTEETKTLLVNLEELWPSGATLNYYVSGNILDKSIDSLAAKKNSLEFDEKYLADDTWGNRTLTESLKAKGYTICTGSLKRIGMKTVSERFLEMQNHYKKELNPEQEGKIKILKDLGEKVLSTGTKPERIKDLKSKEVWIYSREDEKSIVNGQYNTDFVWMAEEVLSGPFEEALSTYGHELAHKYGSDQSADFSYALTDVQTLFIRFLMNADKNEIEDIKKQWQELTK